MLKGHKWFRGNETRIRKNSHLLVLPNNKVVRCSCSVGFRVLSKVKFPKWLTSKARIYKTPRKYRPRSLRYKYNVRT